MNKLTFQKYLGFKKCGNRYYKYALYLCECGNKKEAYEHNVKSNNTRSCGCNYLWEKQLKRWQKQEERQMK